MAINRQSVFQGSNSFSHALQKTLIAAVLPSLMLLGIGCDDPTDTMVGVKTESVEKNDTPSVNSPEGAGSKTTLNNSVQKQNRSESQKDPADTQEENKSKKSADETGKKDGAAQDQEKEKGTDQEKQLQETPTFPDIYELKKVDIGVKLEDSWTQPMKSQEIWVDLKNKQVAVGGYICLRGGLLEMFACPEGTKEHESIVAVFAEPEVIHAALIAIGAKPGSPVQYDPMYKSATGPKVSVEVMWQEDGKTVTRKAQEMVCHVDTKKPLEHQWVFGGSRLWKADDDAKPYYLANGGEFICVSNFSSAMMDLPIESTSAGQELLFEACTEKIPELKTRVLIKLVPEISDKKESDEKKDSKDNSTDKKQDDKGSQLDKKDGTASDKTSNAIKNQ